ncbi:peroxisomal leader peptide-processing protease-like isoform X2 [Mya arenaria]|nr:peroxisomal leader peptide-processing protease-like isoform X2 [Mya arenaria]XP_052800640.1 peroxisomal leader peptide-processing protease-like isoform X2 [Mya arenaria]
MEQAQDPPAPYLQMCTILACPRNAEGKTEGTTSGILIDPCQGLVLTHASLLYPLHEHFSPELLRNLENHGSSLVGTKLFKYHVDIEVTLPNMSLVDGGANKLVSNSDKSLYTVLSSSTAESVKSVGQYHGRVKLVFEAKRLKDVIRKLLPKDQWQFEQDDNGSLSIAENKKEIKKNEYFYYTLLPCFVLIKLTDYHPTHNSLIFRDAKDNKVGDPVEICATPFGSMSPEVFLNSCSRGIISKIAGPGRVLMMTDARCVPGCEGGGLFFVHKNKRYLSGMMIATLCWRNSEWVGLSLACAISELVGSLRKHALVDSHISPTAGMLDKGYATKIKTMLSMAVSISVGANWGSGIILDQHRGIYLTCSHVLKGVEYQKNVIVQNEASDEKTQSSIVFRSVPGRQFDVAVVQSEVTVHDTPGWEKHIVFEYAEPVEGEVVFVVGYGIFRHSFGRVPMVNRGIVSKVNSVNGVPIMVQTTCAVHAGVSGGGVFNIHGQLVAMVICNSRDTASGASYPHVNMCIPIATLAPTLNKYLQTGDETVLQVLSTKNKQIKQLWSMGTEDYCSIMSRM